MIQVVGHARGRRPAEHADGVASPYPCGRALARNGGLRAPFLAGTTTPQKVASAVLKAIQEDRAEIIVNSQPVRPAAALQAAAPQVIPRLLKLAGLTSVEARAAEMRRTGAVE